MQCRFLMLLFNLIVIRAPCKTADNEGQLYTNNLNEMYYMKRNKKKFRPLILR